MTTKIWQKTALRYRNSVFSSSHPARNHNVPVPGKCDPELLPESRNRGDDVSKCVILRVVVGGEGILVRCHQRMLAFFVWKRRWYSMTTPSTSALRISGLCFQIRAVWFSLGVLKFSWVGSHWETTEPPVAGVSTKFPMPWPLGGHGRKKIQAMITVSA